MSNLVLWRLMHPNGQSAHDKAVPGTVATLRSVGDAGLMQSFSAAINRSP
jgi:hypothetical protein